MVGAAACRPRQVAATSAIRLSEADAERTVRQAQTTAHPNLVIKTVQVTGPWTEYPLTTKGRPVYQVVLVGELVSGRVRETFTPVFVVDATTGEIIGDESGG